MARCEAPDHEAECYIECPNGCAAIYWEPDGPCDTWCSESASEAGIELRKRGVLARLSLQINDMPVEKVSEFIGDEKASSLSAGVKNRTMSIRMRSATVQDVIDEISRQLRG